jgi:hypothetical protein
MGYGQVISKNFSAGGTMGGDLTLDGDLIVNGDGSGNYDEIVNGNLTVSSTNKLVLGGDGSDSYIFESAADALDLYAGGVQMLQLLEGGTDYVWSPVDSTIFAMGAGKDLQISISSDDVLIANATQDKDIKFNGDDGGSAITALTLDMSEAGAATFNSDVTVGALLKMTTNTAAKILVADGTSYEEASMSGDATIASGGAVTLASTNTNLTTLANVTTVGALNAGSITSGFGSIDNGSSTANFGATTVDSLDVSDGNIANVGDIDADSVSVADAANGLNINFNGNTTTNKISLTDNLADALNITESTNSYIKFVTSNSGEKIVFSKALDIDAAVQIDSTLTVGTDGSGQDVTFYSDTAGDSFVWDSSAEKLTITGTNGATALDIADGNLVVADNIDLEGDIDVNGTANLDNTDIDGTLVVDGTNISLDSSSTLNIDNSNTSNGVTIGTATSGVPVSIGHSTSETTVNDNLNVTGILDVTDATDSSDDSGDTGALRVEGGASIAKKLYVGTDLDIDGTSNLDAVDIDGAVQIDNTVSVGVNDTGYDVKFFGAAAGSYMLWDEDQNTLEVSGTIQTADLVLNNNRGHYLIVEEEEYLSIKNEKTGKLYKFVLEEIDAND